MFDKECGMQSQNPLAANASDAYSMGQIKPNIAKYSYNTVTKV